MKLENGLKAHNAPIPWQSEAEPLEALDFKWVERFVTETQPEEVKQSMCFASPSERFKFCKRNAVQYTYKVNNGEVASVGKKEGKEIKK